MTFGTRAIIAPDIKDDGIVPNSQAIANNKLRQLRLRLDGRGLIVVLGRDSSKAPKISCIKPMPTQNNES